MGKSLGNAIYLNDSEEVISKKIMGAVTDPNKARKDDPANPDVCMVYYYHKLVSKDNLDTICGECKRGERGCVACKKELINNMMTFLSDVREKRNYYEEHPEEVDRILIEGTKRAKAKAEETMEKVRKNMQLNYFDK